MSGCPYSKFDFEVMDEKCDVTEQLTHSAVKCDFDYKDCPHYQSQRLTERRSANANV